MSTGKKILSIAQKHIGEIYQQGQPAPKDHPNYDGPWDCSEFASFCLYQASEILYGCENNSVHPSRADSYTGYWKRDANVLGTKIGVSEAASIPGAFILREPPDAGKQGHIAISDGAGGTVEAHSRQRGVDRFSIDGRRWSYGILVPQVQYETAAAHAYHVWHGPGFVVRTKDSPMKGKLIRKIQQSLKALGYNPGKIDGIYNRHTEAAVRAFQYRNDIAIDGEVGRDTAALLGVAGIR